MKKVIWAIVLFMLVGLIVQTNEEKNDYRQVMSEATYIENIDEIDESLVGSFVIIAGTPEMKTGAYDSDFDIQFDYPVVYRTAYALYDSGDSSHKTSWGKTYRSDDYQYGSTDLCGEARIGAYTISGDALKWMFRTSRDILVTEELAERIGWVYYSGHSLSGEWMLSKEKTYDNSSFSWLDRGMLRITYDAKSTEGIPCTVFGYLDKDGHIVSTEEYEIKSIEGIMDQKTFLEKY